ncbi:hypothetical protein Zmor_000744 [Zophobas morio]|uniref:Uncharacterized protein n=1 Tax=Zophobas morio TaxID=2755281 RepID=A0AA38MR02_9CUCU|nr:hypothetical protein Zmor_000744 [Zophobas morio]
MPKISHEESHNNKAKNKSPGHRKFANLNYITRKSKSAHSSIQTENQTQPPIPKRKNNIRIFANIKYHCACQTLRTTCVEPYIHKPPVAMIFVRIRTQTKTAADETQTHKNSSKNATLSYGNAAG